MALLLRSGAWPGAPSLSNGVAPIGTVPQHRSTKRRSIQKAMQIKKYGHGRKYFVYIYYSSSRTRLWLWNAHNNSQLARDAHNNSQLAKSYSFLSSQSFRSTDDCIFPTKTTDLVEYGLLHAVLVCPVQVAIHQQQLQRALARRVLQVARDGPLVGRGVFRVVLRSIGHH